MDHTNISKETARIYFAGGCFWGMEKLFESIRGVTDTACGYANGKKTLTPDYQMVCRGDTGYRETVRVDYDPEQVTLQQLLKAYFHVIDPTVQKRQGNDIGDQYQTGIYCTDDRSLQEVRDYAEKEKKHYDRFLVEIGPLTVFCPAEEYHQKYLDKNPGGYCHVPVSLFGTINEIIGTEPRK